MDQCGNNFSVTFHFSGHLRRENGQAQHHNRIQCMRILAQCLPYEYNEHMGIVRLPSISCALAVLPPHFTHALIVQFIAMGRFRLRASVHKNRSVAKINGDCRRSDRISIRRENLAVSHGHEQLCSKCMSIHQFSHRYFALFEFGPFHSHSIPRNACTHTHSKDFSMSFCLSAPAVEPNVT